MAGGRALEFARESNHRRARNLHWAVKASSNCGMHPESCQVRRPWPAARRCSGATADAHSGLWPNGTLSPKRRESHARGLVADTLNQMPRLRRDGCELGLGAFPPSLSGSLESLQPCGHTPRLRGGWAGAIGSPGLLHTEHFVIDPRRASILDGIAEGLSSMTLGTSGGGNPPFGPPRLGQWPTRPRR